jgi:hypothetical protein
MMVSFRNTLDQDPYIDIHVKDYLTLPSSARRLMFGVKLRTPIQWEHREVKLDPYILGMWLGDGTSTGDSFTSADEELVEYWRVWAEQEGGRMTPWATDDIHFGIAGNTNSNPLLAGLRHYGLVNNKHIPSEYLINSEKIRLQVLAGLIDTDGSVEGDGTSICITQCHEHERIITGAKFLAQSLGFHANIRQRNTSWTHKGVTKAGTALTLTISGYGIEHISTLLHRKKCFPPKCTDTTCYKIDVVDAGVGRFCGFEVDQNNRFLLGDFTVTHNCDQTGRTVIGPDPTLRLGEVGVPEEMARILTQPVRVTEFNIKELQALIDSGVVESIIKPDEKTVIDLKRYRRGTRLITGDIIHRGDELITVVDGRELAQVGDKVERNGEFLTKLKYANRSYDLAVGWIVNKPLQNGDYISVNRQPTLHKGSIMAMKVVLRPGKTLRMNLAVVKSFNADFDFLAQISKNGQKQEG